MSKPRMEPVRTRSGVTRRTISRGVCGGGKTAGWASWKGSGCGAAVAGCACGLLALSAASTRRPIGGSGWGAWVGTTGPLLPRGFRQGFHGRQQGAGLKRFLNRAIGLDKLRPRLVDGLLGSGHEDDPHVAVARAHLEVLADIVASAAGHHGIGQHHVGIGVFQADQRGIGVADGDHLVTLIAEDALTHALGVRAVVHQQNAAHFCAGAGVAEPLEAGLRLLMVFCGRPTRIKSWMDKNGRKATILCA